MKNGFSLSGGLFTYLAGVRLVLFLLLAGGLITLLLFGGCARPPRVQQLFNGKDLTGWQHVGPGGMTVDDSLLHGHGGMGLLYWTGGKFADCTFHIVYKMKDSNDNSGV